MPPITRSAHASLPLPQVPGPKLAPFTPTARADIEFVEELGNPAIDMDGFVWKVKINGTASFYALKMLRFNSSMYLRRTSGSYLNRPLVSPNLYIDYFDPFNCECRAYGRLKAAGREELAVQAHGYLLLSPQQEAEVAARISAIDSDESDTDNEAGKTKNPWGRMGEHSGQPVHAIVKNFVDDGHHFTASQVPDLWKDLEDFRTLGILVRDIKIGNYLGGKILDFSRAWTVPHPSLEHIYPRDFEERLERDSAGLEEAIVDLGMAKEWNWDEVEIPEALKNCASGRGENGAYGTDPRLCDWRQWEEDVEAAEAFFENQLYARPEAEDEEGEKK